MRRSPARLVLGGVFILAGTLHFLRPGIYEAIMPDWIPAHRELVALSGVAEAAGGAAVLADRTRIPGGWWLIATLIGIFPANVHMAVNAERYAAIPEALLWARLPLQALLVAWVHRVAIDPRGARCGQPPPMTRGTRCTSPKERADTGIVKRRTDIRNLEER